MRNVARHRANSAIWCPEQGPRTSEVRAPTVVPKLSAKTGVIYAYTRPNEPAAEGYYWTAIDWRDGDTVWMQYAGSGLGFNNRPDR